MRAALSRLRDARFNSSLARRVLGRVYRDGAVYRIPFGPLRGAKLRYRPEVNFHAMLGLWELENVRFITRALLDTGALAPSSVVCDVGANIGTFSLWFARRCVPDGRVYAFEVAPATLAMLRDTLALNAAANVEVVPAACADRTGPVEFFIGKHHHSNSLDATWSGGGEVQPRALVVDGTSLDDVFYGATPRTPPAFVKVDIEGGGVQALPGCRQVCERARPFVLIESHTPDEDAAISAVVTGCDYRAYRVNTGSWVVRPDETHPHPDGIWGTLFLCPAEAHEAMRTALGA
jgi:FkbM family methyltransferase